MKILLITPYFPPHNAIGAVRTGKFAKYLIEHGNEVRVISAEINDIENDLPLEIDDNLIKRPKVFSLDSLAGRIKAKDKTQRRYKQEKLRGNRFGEFFKKLYIDFICFPDRFYGWIPSGYIAGKKIVKEFRPDLIYASAQPYSALVLATVLARQEKIPLVCEFRDLWTQNHYLGSPSWKRSLEWKLEKYVCRNSELLVTVSIDLAEKLSRAHNVNTLTIMNGYDQNDLIRGSYKKKKKLRINYCGMIYPGKRDPSLLFKAISALGAEKHSVEVNFYGKKQGHILELAKQYGVNEQVNVCGEISFIESMRIQSQSDILLLLLWEKPEERGVLTGKLFEYIGNRKPILLIGGTEGEAAEIIEENNFGYVARDESMLIQILRKWIREHKDGFIKPLDKLAAQKFTRERQYCKLAAHLERIKRRQTINIITNKLDIGGTELHLLNMLPNLSQEKYKITIRTIYKNGTLEDKFNKAGVKVITPKNDNALLAKIESTVKLLIHMVASRNEIYHFWLPEAYLIGGICGRLVGVKKMIMSRRSLNNYQHKYKILTKIEKYLHKYMHVVLCNSNAIQNNLLDEGVTKNKVKVIRNVFDMNRLKGLGEGFNYREEAKIGRKTFIIMCIANLNAYKGHTVLLSALNRIKQKLGKDWILLCVGRDDGEQSEILKKAYEYGIANNVRLLGCRNDVLELLQIADMSVLASYEEGSSNAVLESMAIGKPTIATMVGGNTEMIVNNVTGILVKPRRSDELAEAIYRLYSDKYLRCKLGEAARKEVKDNYGVAGSIIEYEEVYDKLLGNEHSNT